MFDFRPAFYIPISLIIFLVISFFYALFAKGLKKLADSFDNELIEIVDSLPKDEQSISETKSFRELLDFRHKAWAAWLVVIALPISFLLYLVHIVGFRPILNLPKSDATLRRAHLLLILTLLCNNPVVFMIVFFQTFFIFIVLVTFRTFDAAFENLTDTSTDILEFIARKRTLSRMLSPLKR